MALTQLVPTEIPTTKSATQPLEATHEQAQLEAKRLSETRLLALPVTGALGALRGVETAAGVQIAMVTRGVALGACVTRN